MKKFEPIINESTTWNVEEDTSCDNDEYVFYTCLAILLIVISAVIVALGEYI